MRIKPFVIAVTLIILIGLAIFARFQYETMQLRYSTTLQLQTYNQLHDGMTVSEVDAVVGKAAWRRYTCSYDTWRREVYLFGSHNLDLTSMLILDYGAKASEFRLEKISGFENYMLSAVINGCSVLDL